MVQNGTNTENSNCCESYRHSSLISSFNKWENRYIKKTPHFKRQWFSMEQSPDQLREMVSNPVDFIHSLYAFAHLQKNFSKWFLKSSASPTAYAFFFFFNTITQLGCGRTLIKIHSLDSYQRPITKGVWEGTLTLSIFISSLLFYFPSMFPSFYGSRCRKYVIKFSIILMEKVIFFSTLQLGKLKLQKRCVYSDRSLGCSLFKNTCQIFFGNQINDNIEFIVQGDS